jgi:hypothetical protein
MELTGPLGLPQFGKETTAGLRQIELGSRGRPAAITAHISDIVALEGYPVQTDAPFVRPDMNR